MTSVPSSTHKIDAEWLTEVLKDGGQIASEVTAVTIETIGAGIGLMGELGRLHITYAAEEDLPNTLVVKCAAQNENRQVAQILDFYNREADFYNRVAPDCSMNVPDSYHADVNQETYDFVLLMEDLGDVAPPDQLVGASEDEIYLSVGNVAEMHAQWWGATAENQPWMYDMMSEQEAERLRSMVYMPALEPCIEKFDYLLTPQTQQLLRTVGQRYAECWSRISLKRDTFVHGDYRQDNMLYIEDEDEPLVMDWQISGRGKPIFDVAYFMCQSVDEALRESIEEEVLKFYTDRLADHGVKYDLEQCMEDYRRILLGCLVYPVTVCGSLDTANERGKMLGETMLIRNLSAIEKFRSADILS
ncbi:MAG: phosphotransferase [Pseudomonadales bacterium]|nr:phosphotransferase [Pseudomonadales bacterium]MBO6656585.1 phosphotransferase [Pseudomonadales bacterium]